MSLVRQVAVQGNLMSQHFGDDENNDRPNDASAGKKVNERVPNSCQENRLCK
jgi:hypothetical protein